jgi:hypothetical protein
MRQNGLLTAGAILDLNRREVMVAAPVALAGAGGTSLGNGHVSRLVVETSGSKIVILERTPRRSRDAFGVASGGLYARRCCPFDPPG